MKIPTNVKSTIPLIAASVFLTALAFLPPNASAVLPAPDGGYPGGNTAEGQAALLSLTTGTYNTGVGVFSLRSNTEANFNTAIGAGTLLLSTGNENTATGPGALLSNTTGYLNTAIGDQALTTNTTGGANTATGSQALRNNTTGNSNTAIGWQALHNNSTGSFNVALGLIAGFNATTGNNNVYIGNGMDGVADESDHTYIRNVNTTSVSGGSADFVTVDLTTGLLGHASSSRRYKEDITPMDDASEALFALKPVTFHYKKEIDRSQGLEYGLIAEDVAQVDPNLAIRDGKGQIETVRYSAINAMLLNEFLKEHEKVRDLEATVAEQQKGMKTLTAQLKEHAAQIQKVSAQVEMSSSPPRMV